RRVEERRAEGEPLDHPAGGRGRSLLPRLPEPEALEQHPDALAPLGHPIEAAVEVEVLERCQLPVDQRLVPEEADPAPVRLDLERPGRGKRETRAEAQQRRLSGSVRPGDDQEPAPLELEVQPAQDTLEPITLLERLRPDHASASASTKAKNVTEMTPFIVKNAVSRRRRSPGRTSECSYASSAAT